MLARASLLCLPLILLGGCASVVETRVNSSGAVKTLPKEYRLAELQKDSSADLIKARELLVDALGNRGMSRSENADAIVTATVSKRLASLSVKTNGQVISAAKKKKPFQSCEDVEYRMTFQLTRPSNGEKLYSGAASEYHCRADLAEVLPILVDALIASMDGAEGTKILTRSGVD